MNPIRNTGNMPSLIPEASSNNIQASNNTSEQDSSSSTASQSTTTNDVNQAAGSTFVLRPTVQQLQLQIAARHINRPPRTRMRAIAADFSSLTAIANDPGSRHLLNRRFDTPGYSEELQAEVDTIERANPHALQQQANPVGFHEQQAIFQAQLANINNPIAQPDAQNNQFDGYRPPSPPMD